MLTVAQEHELSRGLGFLELNLQNYTVPALLPVF